MDKNERPPGEEGAEEENYSAKIIPIPSYDPSYYLEEEDEVLLGLEWADVPHVPAHSTCGGQGRSFVLWPGDTTIKISTWHCKRSDHRDCSQYRAERRFPSIVHLFQDSEVFRVTIEGTPQEVEKFQSRISSKRTTLKKAGIKTIGLSLSRGTEEEIAGLVLFSSADLRKNARLEPKAMTPVEHPLREIAFEMLRPGVKRIQSLDQYNRRTEKTKAKETGGGSRPVDFTVFVPSIRQRMLQLLDEEVHAATGQHLLVTDWDIHVPEVFDKDRLPGLLEDCLQRAVDEYKSSKRIGWGRTR